MPTIDILLGDEDPTPLAGAENPTELNASGLTMTYYPLDLLLGDAGLLLMDASMSGPPPATPRLQRIVRSSVEWEQP